MCKVLDSLFAEDPRLWIDSLAEYQRNPAQTLINKGLSYEQVASAWLTATTSHTSRFGAGGPDRDKGTFMLNLKAELRGFLCGDKKYKKEREGLFGETGLARTYVVSAIAVAIAPHLQVSSVVISPAIALLLASMGKVTLNAWCASTSDRAGGPDEPSTAK